MIEHTLAPTGDRVRALRDNGPDSPIRMLNLLRFRDAADYGERDDAPCSGAEAYERYGTALMELVKKVGGRQVFFGPVHQVMIAPEEEDWDAVLIMHYPSRHAFLKMMGDPDYPQAGYHREAALLDSRLIAMADE